jgi:hypothetical protein
MKRRGTVHRPRLAHGLGPSVRPSGYYGTGLPSAHQRGAFDEVLTYCTVDEQGTGQGEGSRASPERPAIVDPHYSGLV